MAYIRVTQTYISMATITIDIEDHRLEEFYALMQELRFNDAGTNPMEIPDWQVAETLRRIAATRPEDYRPWSELKKKYGR